MKQTFAIIHIIINLGTNWEGRAVVISIVEGTFTAIVYRDADM